MRSFLLEKVLFVRASGGAARGSSRGAGARNSSSQSSGGGGKYSGRLGPDRSAGCLRGSTVGGRGSVVGPSGMSPQDGGGGGGRLGRSRESYPWEAAGNVVWEASGGVIMIVGIGFPC